MQFNIPNTVVDNALEKVDNARLKKARESSVNLGRFTEVNSAWLDKRTLKVLNSLVKENTSAYANNVRFLYKAAKDGVGATFTTMAQLESGIRAYLTADRIKGYVFTIGDHDAVSPYLITEVAQSDSYYYSRRGSTVPGIRGLTVKYAYSTLTTGLNTSYVGISVSRLIRYFEAQGIDYVHEEKETSGEDSYVYTSKLEAAKPISVAQFLEDEFDWYKETDELIKDYETQLARFAKFLPMYGKQFRVRGTAVSRRSYYYNALVSLLVDGKPGRCIMNTLPKVAEDNTEKRHSRRHSEDEELEDEVQFGKDQIILSNGVALADVTPADLVQTVKVPLTEEVLAAPLHPTLRIFHLDKNSNYEVHVMDLAPYKYREDIDSKLILDEDVKQLVEMLVASSADDVDDVVEGKSNSTVIACVGDPGLGKTLLAEVMSEKCKRPLYKLQAAQLGESSEEIERNLTSLLQRAQRWNCVLMIDEANAYIHSRGTDITQNAIVGVFLRKLEYYRGVMILTTNKTADGDGLDFDIDDAILQRCRAVINFNMPSEKMAVKHWLLQAQLLKLDVSTKQAELLAATFHLSGRTIRNLLTMSSRWANHRKETLGMHHFMQCLVHIPKVKGEGLRSKEKTKDSHGKE